MARYTTKNAAFDENHIAALATPDVMERGRALFDEGALEDLSRRGAEISALCAGSEDEPYTLKARLDADGVDALRCSCPYDHEGICKHCVALLLALSRTPEAFESTRKTTGKTTKQSFLGELQRCERDELAQLIVQLVETEPKLRAVVRRLLKPKLSLAEINKVRSSVESAMKKVARMSYDANFSAIGRDLKFHARAAASLEAARPFDAGQLHAAILEGLMSVGPDEFQWDERGVLATAAERSSSALARLASLETVPSELRAQWLALLARAFVFELQTDGLDFAPDAEAMLKSARDDEWPALEAILDAALASNKSPRKIAMFSSSGRVEVEDPTNRWVREAIVALKAERLAARGEEAQAQNLILTSGTPEQQVEVHLQNRDFEAAEALADRHFARYAGLLIDFVERLNHAGEWPRARQFAQRHKLQRWLAQASLERGESDALALNVALFETAPHLAQWRTVMELAAPAERPALHEKLSKALEKRGEHALLFDIALDENDVAQALLLWEKLNGFEKHARYEPLIEATETTHPEEAFLLCDEWAQMLIAHRSRDAYRLAAQALTMGKRVLENAQCDDQWKVYITDLRLQHPKLRALLEELNRAQL